MWTPGIRDKQLLYNIRRILKASIKEKGQLIYPDKGTPQGGIISPLLANIVLNELDHWVESNREQNPIKGKYSGKINIDCKRIGRAVDVLIKNRLNVSRTGRKLTKVEKARYGKSQQLRYIANEPIYPISYVQHKKTMNKMVATYTAEIESITDSTAAVRTQYRIRGQPNLEKLNELRKHAENKILR